MKAVAFLLFGSALAMALSSCGEPTAPASTDSSASTGSSPVDVDARGASVLLEENPEIVVVDVRTPEEFAEGHIAGAVNIDFRGDGFAEKLAELDPGKTYLFHCASGRRSGEAAPQFEAIDPAGLYHLTTGFNSWRDAGLPVED